MAYLSRHDADTNEGRLSSPYDNTGIDWNGDFAECVEMGKVIERFERAAYRAGFNLAEEAINRARQTIKENS